MRNQSYWQQQLSRRKALKAAALAGGGAAALALIGCGGDDSGGGGVKGDASGLLSAPTETTSKATRGGTYATHLTSEQITLDPIFYPSTENGLVYSFMTRHKMEKYPNRFKSEIEPDAMESWEVSNDGLQFTFKVRPNMKFDPRPPTNSRLLDAEDVKYSWDYFAESGNSKSTLANKAAADAPILSMEAADSRTVIVKLAYPYAPLLTMLSYSRGMMLLPREAGREGSAGFNVREEMRGTGAFRLMKRQISVNYEYARNPDWYDADKVYLDGHEVFVIPEYATQMAQFRTGALWHNASIRQEDILPTKRESPELLMQAGVDYDKGPSPWVSFGSLPGSPFLDERVRRALSMLWDRDLWISTFFNTDNFTKEGLPVDIRWNSHVMGGYDGYWIDPRSKEIGEGAKNFEYNPTEAKALMRAAGHTKALETTLNYSLNAYGSTFNNQVETYRSMWEANGDFKFKLNNPDYRSEWLAAARPGAKAGEWNGAYHFGRGTYEGIAVGTGNAYPEVDAQVQAYFREGSIRQMRAWEDKTLDNLVDKQRQELNNEKRVETLKELQRHTAKTMPGFFEPGSVPLYTIAHPWVGNRGLWNTNSNAHQNYMYIWYDASKKKA